MKMIFELPDEVILNGVVISKSDLKTALKSEDLSVLRPLIDAVVRTKGGEREKLFNFLLSGIQFSIEHFVKRTFGYFDAETQEDIFWQGVAYVWENLANYDESKSEFNTWLWNQVRYGSRNALRKEIKAKKLLARCENNPALVAEEILYTGKRGESDRGGTLAGVPVTSLGSAIGRELDELSKEESNALRDAINSLKERDRDLIIMKVLLQLDTNEIAERLGPEVSVGAINTAYSRAKERLQNQYLRKLREERVKPQ